MQQHEQTHRDLIELIEELEEDVTPNAYSALIDFADELGGQADLLLRQRDLAEQRAESYRASFESVRSKYARCLTKIRDATEALRGC